MQVLPSLLEVCPEARLNLAVHYLRQGQLQDAFKLVEDLQPATPQEYTLKGQYPLAQPNSTRSGMKMPLAQCDHCACSQPASCLLALCRKS